MSTSPWAIQRSDANTSSRVRDWAELTKPRLTLMVLVTVAVGAIASGASWVDLATLCHLLVGTALVAASSSAANQCLERNRDRLMRRTASRPLPSGRIATAEAACFAVATLVVGAAYLSFAVNFTVAALGLLTWITYVVVYTPLKSRTTANTVVGAIAGALPILMGWAASGRGFDMFAVSLFAIVYLWQFPHFMAIAWIYRDDYRRAGYRMLPSADDSGQRAAALATAGAVSLLSVSLLPAVFAGAGLDYLVWALTLGFMYLAAAVRFRIATNDHSARTLLRASLVYLPALLVWLSLTPR